MEGPLGEWTGYYAGGAESARAIRVETFWHRDDPVLTGAIPGIPPNDDTFYRGTARAGAVWQEIEAAGVPGVMGVWSHEAGGCRMWLTVSIKQMYGGHSKQAGLIASQCHAGAYANRVVVVVDDDIDPGQHGQGGVGDLHALRPQGRRRDPEGLLVDAPRPDGLRRQPQLQQPHGDRRLHPVGPQEGLARDRAELGRAGDPHQGEVRGFDPEELVLMITTKGLASTFLPPQGGRKVVAIQ